MLPLILTIIGITQRQTRFSSAPATPQALQSGRVMTGDAVARLVLANLPPLPEAAIFEEVVRLSPICSIMQQTLGALDMGVKRPESGDAARGNAKEH